MKTIYEAVLCRVDGGDLDVVELPTLKCAKKELKRMIDGKPYHDAYIRRFDYLDDDLNGRYTTRDYELK
mgnify:FL=1